MLLVATVRYHTLDSTLSVHQEDTTKLQQPELRFVGIDPETHQAVVWSGRHEAAVVAADLFNIVQEPGAPA